MKNLLFALLITAVSSMSMQTNAQTADSTNSPSQAAVKFTKAMMSLNVKEAEKYVTSSSAAILDKAAPMIEAQSSSIPDSIKTMLNSAKITTSDEKITNDSATVKLTTAFEKSPDGGDKEKSETLSLVKESGIWKVILNLGGAMGQ